MSAIDWNLTQAKPYSVRTAIAHHLGVSERSARPPQLDASVARISAASLESTRASAQARTTDQRMSDLLRHHKTDELGHSAAHAGIKVIAHQVEHSVGPIAGFQVELLFNVAIGLPEKWEEPNGRRDAIVEAVSLIGVATAVETVAALEGWAGALALPVALAMEPIAKGAKPHLEKLTEEQRHCLDVMGPLAGGPDYRGLLVATDAFQVPARTFHAATHGLSEAAKKGLDALSVTETHIVECASMPAGHAPAKEVAAIIADSSPHLAQASGAVMKLIGDGCKSLEPAPF